MFWYTYGGERVRTAVVVGTYRRYSTTLTKYLPTHLPTYLPTYLTYLPTYLPTSPEHHLPT